MAVVYALWHVGQFFKLKRGHWGIPNTVIPTRTSGLFTSQLDSPDKLMCFVFVFLILGILIPFLGTKDSQSHESSLSGSCTPNDSSSFHASTTSWQFWNEKTIPRYQTESFCNNSVSNQDC